MFTLRFFYSNARLMPKFQLKEKYELEQGGFLKNPILEYKTYGKLNHDGSNVVWVCHALTANAEVFDWWAGLFGDDDFFNPKDHYIVCANFIGSHYGSTGPLSIAPDTGEQYLHDFPQITIRDMVGLQIHLADYLNINTIHLLIGGSMGGHQALEWSIMQAPRIKNMCLLASSAIISPWAVAFNESQRMAIENDPTWTSSLPTAGLKGMEVARSIALLSYRNQHTYNETQKEDHANGFYTHKAASYQRYQGQKLTKRFNAFSYWHISKAMDSHNVARNRGDITEILKSVQARTLILSFQSDLLFPLEDQKFMERWIPDATLEMIPSLYGHDGFLIEVEKIEDRLKSFLTV